MGIRTCLSYIFKNIPETVSTLFLRWFFGLCHRILVAMPIDAVHKPGIQERFWGQCLWCCLFPMDNKYPDDGEIVGKTQKPETVQDVIFLEEQLQEGGTDVICGDEFYFYPYMQLLLFKS